MKVHLPLSHHVKRNNIKEHTMSNAPQTQKSPSQTTPSSNTPSAEKNATIALKDGNKAKTDMKEGSCSTTGSASDAKSSCGTK
jgi:hypothetical protein